jgi:hypothetical protein
MKIAGGFVPSTIHQINPEFTKLCLKNLARFNLSQRNPEKEFFYPLIVSFRNHSRANSTQKEESRRMTHIIVSFQIPGRVYFSISEVIGIGRSQNV